MKYTDFIRDFSLVLNENGIRITQPKLKELFDDYCSLEKSKVEVLQK